MNLTKQEVKVYNFISENPGATTRDIINATYVTCPSGRITEMRKKGIPIVSIGQKRYAGARAFEMYAIGNASRTPAPQPAATQIRKTSMKVEQLAINV